jgi:tetratricopeptide (TPR) repeat protein
MTMTRTAALASTALVLAIIAGGCSSGHGKQTTEAIQQANQRVSGIKAGNEYQQAWQAYTAGDLAKAAKSIDRCITLNPSVAKSYVLKGRIDIERSALEQSLESFQKAESLEPNNVEAQYYMGIVFERFSQTDQAKERYMKAAELESTNPQYALAAAEMMIELNDLDGAQDYLTSRTASFEHNAGVRQTLGHIAMMKNDTALGAKLFAEARLLAPDDTNILEDLVHAQIETQAYADAEFNITKLLKVPENKDRRDLKHARARCLMELDRPLDAREVYADLTASDGGSRDVDAWIGLGNTSYILRDMLRLRQSSARVVALAPTRPEGYVLRAWYDLRAERPQEALEQLDKAIEHRGGNVDPLLLKAMVLKDIGRFEEARAAVAQAQLEAPTNPAVAEARANLMELPATATVPEAQEAPPADR